MYLQQQIRVRTISQGPCNHKWHYCNMNISQYYIWIPATHTVPVFSLLTMTNRSNQINGLVMTNLTFLFPRFCIENPVSHRVECKLIRRVQHTDTITRKGIPCCTTIGQAWEKLKFGVRRNVRKVYSHYNIYLTIYIT